MSEQGLRRGCLNSIIPALAVWLIIVGLVLLGLGLTR